MKNLLTILPLVALCCACSSDIIDAPDKFTIGFIAKVKATRADIGDVQTNGFSVWGGYAGNETLFNGRKVTFSAPNWVCEGPSEVWTLNNTYNFLAIHPVQDASKVIASTTDSKVYHKFTYNVPANAGTDLLIASEQLTFAESQNGSVPLQFAHALSNINVKVQKNTGNNGDNVVVQQVSIRNAKKSAVYNTETSAWEEFVDGFNYTSAGNLNVTLPETTDAEPYADIISGLCFIPQTINANSVQVSITYSIQEGSSVDFYTADAYIPESPKWEGGKKYTYSLILGPKKNDILFGVPEVQDWIRTDQVGGSIMIQ